MKHVYLLEHGKDGRFVTIGIFTSKQRRKSKLEMPHPVKANK